MSLGLMVVKRDGRLENFDIVKLSASIDKAGAKDASSRVAKAVLKQVGDAKSVESTRLRELAIAELQALDASAATAFSTYQKAARNLSSHEHVLENKLRSMVGDFGQIRAVYGGFHISITDETSFDYAGVFKTLLESGLSIAIENADGRIRIVTK